MDQPDLDLRLHREALRGLERINFLSGSARILWPAIRGLANDGLDGPLRVLDIATGAGDVPLTLWHRAQRSGLPLQIAGCDTSPTAVAYARKRAFEQKAEVRFFELDAIASDIPTGYDIVVCSLFLHHLREDEAVGLLSRMKDAAARSVLVNDLLRSGAGLLLAIVGTWLLSRSPIVRTDGPRSVEGAFTVEEVAQMAQRAGLQGANVSRRWPCRYLMTWTRDESGSNT